MRKPTLVLTVALVCTMAYGALAEPTNTGVVSIVNVTNENSPTELIAGSSHTVSIQYDFWDLNGGLPWWTANAFEVYSTDGANWVNLLATHGPFVTALPPSVFKFSKYYTSTDNGVSFTETGSGGSLRPGGSTGENSRVAYSLVTLDFTGAAGFLADTKGIALYVEFQTLIDDIGWHICFDTAIMANGYQYWEWASSSFIDWPNWDNGSGDQDASVPRCWEIVGPDGFTPPGSPVEVEVDETLTVTFDDVTSGGVTTVTTQTAGPAPPDGYQVVPGQGQPVYYDIETTATYSGQIEVCFKYTESQVAGQESNLKLLHWTGTPPASSDITIYPVDVDNNVICGVTSSLSLFALAEPIQSIAGQVVADCPAPLTGLLGVNVDAFALGTGDLVGTAVTGADGHYLIADLPPADYTATLVTPLGFSTEIDEILIEEQPGQTLIADFALTCVDITANPRGIGFWKHQVGVALGGKGKAQIDGPTLCDHLDLIANHFNSNQINQVVVYDPPVSEVCADKLLVAKELMNLKGNAGMTARAKQQLTALLLNVAAAYISQTEIISEDGATVSQAITFCDNLIDDPEGDHEAAKTICDDINNNRQVAAGVIPLSTDNIAYKRIPAFFDLAQNYPNPFNPATEIKFSLPEATAVRLDVFSITGQRVAILVDDNREAGDHSVVWDGSGFASGVYLYRLTAGEFMETKKMVLLK